MLKRTILDMSVMFLYVYIFLLTIRIVFSWFKPNIDTRCRSNTSKIWHYLCLVTGPYLALFRGLKDFKSGAFDYSPIVAVFALLVVTRSAGLVLLATRMTPEVIIVALFLGIWEAFEIILLFFFFLCVVRLLGLFISNRTFDRFLNTIDIALQPFVSIILKVTHRRLAYPTILLLCIALIAVICIAGNFSLKSLYRDLSVM